MFILLSFIIIHRLAGVLDLYFEKHKDKHEFEFNMNSNTPENSNGNSNNNTVNESSGNENAVPSLINISGRLSIRSGEISWMVISIIIIILLYLTLSYYFYFYFFIDKW